MVIQVDTREKPGAIQLLLKDFDRLGITHFRSKLPCGDYMSLDNAKLCVDRKQDLLELCSNVTQQHTRFIQEIKRAEDYGIRLIFLCEHGYGIKTLDDVKAWKNPRRFNYPKATNGETLYKILQTMSVRHNNIKFEFCDKTQTGKIITELLDVGHEKLFG